MGRINPALIDSMGQHMADVYGAVSDQILINLAHYFPYWKPGQPVPTSTFEYQANMLAQMGQVTNETVGIIRGMLGGGNASLTAVLQQAIIEAVRKAQPELLKGVMSGILSPPTGAQPILSPGQSQAFTRYYAQASDKLNMVNTVMLESTQQAYQATVSNIAARMNRVQRALDVGAAETVTGVESWNRAMQHSINALKQTGIVGFIDHAGHRWSAEAYVSMDIRTTVSNTARAAVWETNESFGNDLYLVSTHNGARPLCYPYQNKVISAIDAARTVEDLDGNKIEVLAQSATSYGEPAGLFGVNCRHFPTPFIPGVSLADGDPQSEEENDRVYQESQQQRALERKLREDKRDLAMLKAQGAPDDIIRAQRDNVRQSDAQLQEFCDRTNRARRKNREGVYTARRFPDPHTYDVATFYNQQRNVMRQYFSNGGTQQPYTFGQMTPNTPPPVTPPPVAPAPAANVAQQATQTATGTVQSQVANSVLNVKDFAEYKAYMGGNYGIEVTAGVKKLNLDLVKQATAGFESVARDFPEVTKGIKKIRLSRSGVMSCNGEQITFNSDYFEDRLTLRVDIADAVKRHWWQEGTTVQSIGAHETAHGVEMVLIEKSGKYKTQRAIVQAWNECYEARDIVKEACDELLTLPENAGKTAFELIREQISGYGAKGGNSETMAEAFADVDARGAAATPLAKKIYEVSLRKYRVYMGATP